MAKAIDLNIIHGAEKAARYPSEDAPRQGFLTKSLPGRTLTGRRERVDPAKTTLFDGNPRNFSTNKDVSDLTPLIIQTGGNTQAVDARVVNGRIEIIAGSRRRQVCIENGLKLTCDIWEDISDEEASLIAEMENSGRKDIDFMGYCTYLAERFERLKKTDTTLTMERFAQFYQQNRQYMHEKVSIGRLPGWLKDGARTGAPWSHRQGLKLLNHYNKLRDQVMDFETRLISKGMPFSTPTLLLGELSNLVSETEGGNNEEAATTEKQYKVGTDIVAVRTGKKGRLEIHARTLPDNIRAKIVAFIASLGEESIK